MPYCSVPYCRSSSKIQEKISFHQFPVEINRRILWLEAISKKGKSKDSPWVPNQYSVVCHKHFKQDDYRLGPKRSFLKNDAVPSIFPVSPANFKHPPRREKKSLDVLEQKKMPIQPCDVPKSLENEPILSSSLILPSTVDTQLSDTHGSRDMSENQNHPTIERILSDAFSNCTNIEL